MNALTTTLSKLQDVFKEGYNMALMQGGQGSGKNWSCALYLLERQDCRIITIMTDTYSNLKDGIITDYEAIFEWSGLNFYDYFNKADMVLTWGKSKIQFRYLHDLKGGSGKSKRRDLLYINEGNRVGWAAVEHYIARSKQVIVDFNPDYEFWVHEELAPRKDAKLFITTYLDNEMCPANEVAYIESRRHKKAWFKVYGLGQTGVYSDRQIYNFEVVDEIPKDAIRIASGMDYGKSPDPTVLMDCYIKGIDMYVDEVFIENNLMPEKIKGAERKSIVDKMDEIRFPKSQLIIGDSAGKTEITDLAKHGYRVKAVKKGPGSVLLGMKRLNSYNIKVTKRSERTAKALTGWLYDEDNNGKILPQAPKAHEPDTIASIRYVAMARGHWDYLLKTAAKEKEQPVAQDNMGNPIYKKTKQQPRGRGQK